MFIHIDRFEGEGVSDRFDEMMGSPVATFAQAAGAIAIGAGLETLRAAGGKYAGAARCATVGLGVMTGFVLGLRMKESAVAVIAVAGVQVLMADNQMKEAGKQLVDAGVFVGAAKLGSHMLTNVPILNSLMGPKISEKARMSVPPEAGVQSSEISSTLRFETVGTDRVKILREAVDVHNKTLVRLTNEKGFFVDQADRQGYFLPLSTFPSRTSIGQLEYGK